MTTRLLRGDCREMLPTLEPGAVQACITSPPYYGLRDYGLPPLVWGGDADCAHVWETAPRGIGHVKGNKVASTASTLTNGDYQFGALSNPLATTHLCSCGAFSNDLWTQSVADARVGNAIGVQVRSGVIRAAIHVASAVLQLSEPQDYIGLLALDSQIRQQRANHFATLDVAQVPVIRRAASHAVRFANGDVSAEQFLKEIHGLWITLPDGNILHEAWRIALLDGAIIDVDGNTSVSVNDASQIGQFEFGHHQQDTTPTPRSRKEPTRGERYGAARGSAPGRTPDRDGGFQTGARNRRNSDWFFESWQGLMLDEQDDPLALVVNPQPFTGAHFATFPAKLVEPMIKASTRPGDTILDPFAGAGTVGLVADRLQRNAILCELKPDYADMGAERITNDSPMFAEVAD